MPKSLTVLFVAYATGLLCVGWLIHLVKKLPMHTFYKVLLVIVLPIPPACIGWVVTYYGPSPGNMETIELKHYAVMAETVCEGLGAGALSMIALFGAWFAGGRIGRARQQRRQAAEKLSQEALESIDDWSKSRTRHRPTARELRGEDGEEPEPEQRITSRTHFGRAPDPD